MEELEKDMPARFIFLSYPLNSETPAYGNGEGLSVEQVSSIERGDASNTQRWHLQNHLGTHVDAPHHFLKDGKVITDFQADFWVFHHVTVVSAEAIRDLIISPEVINIILPEKTELLLIKTGFGNKRGTSEYWEKNPGLHHSWANWLSEKAPKLRAVGVDTISISSWQNRKEGRKAHRAFLGSLVLIEDMDLRIVNTKTCFVRVIIAPLRVAGSDGAPCTVIGEVKNSGR